MFIAKKILFLPFCLIINFVKSENLNCMPLTASIYFGSKRVGSCFDVSVSKLKQIIVHTQINIVGFTFNFIEGTNESYFENKGIMTDHAIDLNNIYLIGANVYVGEGIEGFKFKFYNLTTKTSNSTQIIGNSQSGCAFYFDSDSRFLKAQSLVITSMKGCVDDKNSTNFPFLEFSYLFSQCPLDILFGLSTQSSSISSAETTTSFTTSSKKTTIFSTESTTMSSTISTSSSVIYNVTELSIRLINGKFSVVMKNYIVSYE